MEGRLPGTEIRGAGLQVVAAAIPSDTTWLNATTIELVTPTHLPPGTYDVTLINPDGTVYKARNALTLTGPDDVDGDGIVNELDNCPAVANYDQTDTDGDLVGDRCDNCTAVTNASQLDTDGDGHGNACDGDFNQDGFVGGPDFTLFIGCFNQPTGGNSICEAADMNGDGFVGGPDFSLFIAGFNGAPGPAAP